MTENPLPTAPDTPRRTWRDRLPRRLPSGRKAVAASAVVAGLAIGGAGFGAGYAVADDGTADTATTRTTDDWGGRGYPGGPGGEMGGGQLGVPPGDPTQGGGTGGGSTDQAPDFDGDGVPDTDIDTATQNS
jgi:hypothetical protein